MAEHGFFVREMNTGWAEWKAAELPTHSGRVAHGTVRCACSFPDDAHAGAGDAAAAPAP